MPRRRPRARTAPISPDWIEGFERGVQSGYAEGYRAGVSVFDDAAKALAALMPAVRRQIDAKAARERALRGAACG